MTNDIPVIKLFFINDLYYVYDTYNNRVLKINKEQYKELDCLSREGISNYINNHGDTPASKDILQLMEKGYFRGQWIKEIINPETPFVHDIIKRGLSKLTLQVTQDCNFSCRYCLFTKDNNVKRTHKKINMSWDTAKKSIDFLWDHCKDVPEVNIAFYGGEPLLNYPLIKNVIDYSTKKFEVKKVKFNMTTNGSIITDEMIDYFAKFNVALTISLDGPQEIQDRHRKFYSNGLNTFDVVWNNVKKIRNRQPEWYNDHVYFHPVVLPGEIPNKTFDFFQSNSINANKISIVNANMEGIDYIRYNDINLQNYVDMNNETKKYLNRNLEEFKKMYRDKSKITEQWHHNGPCVPGKNKIFVDVQGDIYPCEQVIDVACNSIGNIFDGINENRVKELMNIGTITEEQCKNCFAMRYCNICMKKCYNPETQSIDETIKQHYCINTRRGLVTCLKLFVSQEEEN